jgi:hypothetical protein
MTTDSMENVFMNSLELFVSEAAKYDNLKIVAEVEGGGCNGSDILVLENSDVAEDVEGHQITVELPEIFAKCYDSKTVSRFLKVINCEENPIKCFGVTRIVGYYSRVQNWNKSKIGELRDRQEGRYGTGNHNTEYKKEALATVNAL